MPDHVAVSSFLTLRLVGVVLLLAALVTPGLLVTLAPIGTDGPDTFVGPDSAATVPVVDHRATMLWSNEGDAGTPCSAAAPDGRTLPLVPVSDGPRRPGGSIGDYVGSFTVRPDSSTIVVTCAAGSGVHVTAVPHAVAGWQAVLLVIAATLGLAAAGLACLALHRRRSVPTPLRPPT